MVQLKGNNLGKRQKELNLKVNEVAAGKTDFNKVQAETGNSDVDNLFKIDLASKYRNIDYILEVLKSGDSLYISRALKCTWLYDDEFTNIINPKYLHQNIFPFMSIKMKKKLLSAVSTHVRDEKRSEDFYTYCMDSKICSIALKFLIFTSESFKIQVITENPKSLQAICYMEGEHLKHLVGNSFHLAEVYIKSFRNNEVLYKLRYLYTVSDVKYLELIQKYHVNMSSHGTWRCRLGLRISRDFMNKHKSRIIEYPLLYLSIINKNILVTYTTGDDAKLYAVALLPQEHFWTANYYKTHKHIIDKIPFEERFPFMKKIFTEKYPDVEFEMNSEFYTQGYYDLMTMEEREAWALRHISSGAEILGTGEDYTWYKFVNFEKAFTDIKKYIMITPEKDKRLNSFTVLIESAKNQEDLEKLLNYYYERHINEANYVKEYFIRHINDNHNIMEFNENCWTILNEILYSLNVYNQRSHGYFVEIFRVISFIHHIINKKDVPDILKHFMETEAIKMHYLKESCDKLSKEKKEMVFQYMLQFYENKMIIFDKEKGPEEKDRARDYIYTFLCFLTTFNQTNDSVPEIFLKYIKLDWDTYKSHNLFKVKDEAQTQDNLLRCLKQEAKSVVEKLPQVKRNMQRSFFKLNQFLSKLKVYFPDDIAMDYLEFFKNLLLEPELNYNAAKVAVYAIFQLADEKFKTEFMVQYVPTDKKIDHANKDRYQLQVQEAICSYVCTSRPPVPLANVLTYIEGDYVRYCLPMFNSYVANQPLPLCMEFVESIIDKPISVQKHGIRLAFQCFNVENLKKLLTNIWEKTKNVSLRSIIYKALLAKISEEHQHDQKELFDILKTFTLDLNKDDDKELYSLVLRNKLPDYFISEHLECVWITVNKLPRKSANIKLMCKVLNCMAQNIHLFPQGAPQSIIDDHVNNMFKDKQILNKKVTQDAELLINAKWELVIMNLVHVSTSAQLEKNLVVVNNVIKKCLEMWNEIRNETYVTRKFCLEFIGNLDTKGYHNFFDSYQNLNIIFKAILKIFENTLSVHEIYMLVWNLRLSILTREVVISAKGKLAKENTSDVDILEEISIIYSKGLRDLLKEYMEKGLFYNYFFSDIVDEITTKLLNLIRCLPQFREQTFLLDDIFVLMSNTLIEIESPQMFILALMILPKNKNKRFSNVYSNVIKKISALENDEVKCILKHRLFYDCTDNMLD